MPERSTSTMARYNRDSQQAPTRNNYFFGKMLDVYHYELETNYHNSKRWMINRRILGYGVVCGLNILPGPNVDKEIVITAGIALDGHGHEILVPVDTTCRISEDMLTSAIKRANPDEKINLHVLLCYRECLSDPMPTLAGDCNTGEQCLPGAIREKFEIKFCAGHAPEIACERRIPDLIVRGRMDYGALVRWVTQDCVPLPKDPCIPLANLRFEKGVGGAYQLCQNEIDISCRPIVYTNRLLFDILLCMMGGTGASGYGQRD